eukprot:TRINITY_DN24470_c0_g1_i3.p1 TRINITY_DN24470_c0_g1~~TRINITY_DN24470_c0_g1_i3.p1  ORF type:complete len:320 (+),score=40.23 TRINITY_DN24470_c0_g1_i3:32-991(+)
MPSPYPTYEPGVPKSCISSIVTKDAVGQAGGSAGAKPCCTYIARRGVFAFERELTCDLLQLAFAGVGRGADAARCRQRTRDAWCQLLDECDVKAVDYHHHDDCDGYVRRLVDLCAQITLECTGEGFAQWGITDARREHLLNGWKHFVRLVWMRHPAWEDLVRSISASEASTARTELLNSAASCALTMQLRYHVTNKLLVPLQVWNALLTAKGRGPGHIIHRRPKTLKDTDAGRSATRVPRGAVLPSVPGSNKIYVGAASAKRRSKMRLIIFYGAADSARTWATWCRMAPEDIEVANFLRCPRRFHVSAFAPINLVCCLA